MFTALFIGNHEYDVPKDTFISVVSEISFVEDVICLQDEDGCFNYYIWHGYNNEFNYIATSSERIDIPDLKCIT